MKRNPTRIKPTIRMIAEHVGVSPTTVSLALRGDPSIPSATRARVLTAARELNYVPKPRRARAKQLVLRRIAFVMPNFGDQPVSANPFYGEVLRGAEQECQRRRASLLFTLLSNHDPLTPERLSVFGRDSVDGLLLVGPYPPGLVHTVARYSQRPLVLVDNTLPGQPYDSVMADDFGGGYLATQHLIELGHHAIVIVGVEAGVPSFSERERGYRAACQAAGIDPLPPLAVVWDVERMVERVAAHLAQQPAVTAFFCVGDAYAALLIQVLERLGQRVPEDCSVVGFDDLAPMRFVRPALTTITNHPRTLGAVAVQRLMALWDGEARPTQAIKIGTELKVRASSGPHRRREM
ncbi:LacI family DNA-binding transcriptional regulator [Kallotenue papyrolyticum]|uniref:LacI family DNA-binding transcriptional regulator n=1 Tax=Kallotenue papyrolyticum TaxID=1325125 RepID=UPI0004B32E47|nr:LacI family DNA-binding transcriptional regulator [Kallotenue papyrolyticum]